MPGSFAAFATLPALLAVLAGAPLPPPGAAELDFARAVFKQLVEFDTTQSAGDTTRAAEAVAARLRATGIPAADVQIVGPSAKKKNLVARLHGTGRRRPLLLLLAHLDVVDARRADWTIDPFVFTERDGYFYGRGTQDDKSLAALWIAIFARLHREHVPLDRDVVLALTADEENGPENGVSWLLAHERRLVDAELALTEGGGGELKGARRLSIDVQPAEKSYLTFTIEAKNKGGHSSLPEVDNAIVHVAEAAARIHHHAFPVEIGPVARVYFERMAVIEGGAVGADMRAVLGTPPDDAAAARLSKNPLYNARLRTTCVPTQIEGGHAENALPQSARATINCRVMPGHAADEIARALVGIIADPAVQLAQPRAMDPSAASPLPPALLATVERAGAAVWPGVPVLPILLTGATDGRHLRTAGIPCYGLTGLFVDVDDIRAHGRDERLLVRSFVEAHDFLTRVVLDLVSSTLKIRRPTTKLPTPHAPSTATGRATAASEAPSIMTARRPSLRAVSGSSASTGCSTSGKCVAEKNTPDTTNMGIMTRFMRPPTVSVFWARLATRMARPAKASAPANDTTPSATQLPVTRTSKARRANRRMLPTSNGTEPERAMACASNRSRRRMGVASKRLSSLRTRMLTMTQPMPHIDPDIRFMPTMPGRRKSM